MSTEQFEADRENEAVGPDYPEPLSPLGQAIADEDLEECLRILDEQERERVKLACVAGLLALGIVPRSLVRERN